MRVCGRCGHVYRTMPPQPIPPQSIQPTVAMAPVAVRRSLSPGMKTGLICAAVFLVIVFTLIFFARRPADRPFFGRWDSGRDMGTLRLIFNPDGTGTIWTKRPIYTDERIGDRVFPMQTAVETKDHRLTWYTHGNVLVIESSGASREIGGKWIWSVSDDHRHLILVDTETGAPNEYSRSN